MRWHDAARTKLLESEQKNLSKATFVKIIVNGVYAPGKTKFGNWLKDHRGFDHIDLEAINRSLWGGIPEKVASSTKPTVVTWGVPVDEQSFAFVRAFKDVTGHLKTSQ